MDKIIRYSVYLGLFVAFTTMSYKAYKKLANYTISTTVEYRFGDDNMGNFVFPGITLCPGLFETAFEAKLKQVCGNVTKFPNFGVAADGCSQMGTSLSAFLEAIDFPIDQLVRLFNLGDFKLIGKNMGDYWRKQLDYKRGFCYTFDPLKNESGTLRLSSKKDTVSNYALLSLNLAAINGSNVNVYIDDPRKDLPDAIWAKFNLKMDSKNMKEVKFSKTVITALSRPKKLCTMDTIGPETCTARHIEAIFADVAHCKMPWMTSVPDAAGVALCTSAESLRILVQIYNCSVDPATNCINDQWKKEIASCSRLLACQHSIYDHVLIANETFYASTLKIIVDNEYVVYVDDFVSYDFNSFFGEVGGTLGALLGISIAHMFEFLNYARQRLFVGCFRERKPDRT